MKNRPSTQGTTVTTPAAITWLSLLGSGVTSGNVTLTKSEFAAVRKMYGFTAEKPNKKPAPPTEPQKKDFKDEWTYRSALDKHRKAMETWDKWTDPRPIMQVGADRNAVRHAEADGLRIVAYLARYVPAGADPLKTLIQSLAAAGFDVPYEDVEWADSEDENDVATEEEVP